MSNWGNERTRATLHLIDEAPVVPVDESVIQAYARLGADAKRMARRVPDATGFAYRCRHDEGRYAWAMFTDPEVRQHPLLEATGDQPPWTVPAAELWFGGSSLRTTPPLAVVMSSSTQGAIME